MCCHYNGVVVGERVTIEDSIMHNYISGFNHMKNIVSQTAIHGTIIKLCNSLIFSFFCVCVMSEARCF